jgi:hypothetical protein
MRTMISALLAVCLGLAAPAGAAPPASGPPEPAPLQSFSFRADCAQSPGVMDVRTESAGPDAFRIAMSATGLVPGFARGGIHLDGAEPYEQWEIDQDATDVEHETTYPAALTVGRRVLVTLLDFTPLVGVCSVSGATSPGRIEVSAATRSFVATHRKVEAWWQHVDCRGQTVSGRAVVRYADRTVRKRLRSGDCVADEGHHGLVRLRTTYSRGPLPLAVRVVLHRDDDTWRGSYVVGRLEP